MLTADAELTMREFAAGDEDAFRSLNEEWIRRHFVIEAKDEEVLSNPQKYILDRGGKVYFAVRGDEIVGCCALLRIGAGEFEVAKMAVAPKWRRAGVGRQLLRQVVEKARHLGAWRLYLETNGELAAAVALYESVGFRHLPPERVVPSPYARANVYMEMIL